MNSLSAVFFVFGFVKLNPIALITFLTQGHRDKRTKRYIKQRVMLSLSANPS